MDLQVIINQTMNMMFKCLISESQINILEARQQTRLVNNYY